MNNLMKGWKRSSHVFFAHSWPKKNRYYTNVHSSPKKGTKVTKLCKMHIFFSYQSYLRPILRIKSPLCLHYITFRPKNISAFSRNRPHRGSYNEWSTNKSQNLVCNFHPIYNIPECPSKKKMFKSIMDSFYPPPGLPWNCLTSLSERHLHLFW